MIEYYGWIALRSTTTDVAVSNSVAEEVLARVAKEDSSARILDCRYLNGELVLVCAGVRNHRAEWDLTLRLCTELVRLAPASYGVLRLRDDSEPILANRFLLHVVRRGRWSVEPDSVLSPCCPTIEDELPLGEVD